MGIVFTIAVFLLGFLLFRMLNQPEKTYGYTQTATITYNSDGSEQVQNADENGILFVDKKYVKVEGEQYIHKSSDRKKMQARLNYDGNTLKTVSIFLPNNGEKFYFVGKITSVKDLRR
ncbi:MAG TPA: hypothetical protein VL098_03735 [Flavipsychrobacter sp.]|nr:hypothetical protein [Flavipsychrobacter sp.]